VKALLLVCGVAASAAAQICLKYSARFDPWGGRWLALTAAGAACYGISFFIYSFLLREDDLSRISPIMTSAVLLAVVGAGVLLFGEQMTLRRGIGIALGFAAVLLLAK